MTEPREPTLKQWKRRALWAGEQPPAQPCEPTPAEIAHRAKHLAAEMDTVGQAMVKQSQFTGDAALRGSGWDLQDAAEALRDAIKEQT